MPFFFSLGGKWCNVACDLHNPFWCCVHGAHAMGQQFHGSPPAQILPWEQSYRNHLLLLSTFVFFYTLSSLFTIYLTFLLDPGWLIVNATGILSMCFPCLSPFLLMRHSFSSSILCCTWIKNRKILPNFITNMRIKFEEFSFVFSPVYRSLITNKQS